MFRDPFEVVAVLFATGASALVLWAGFLVLKYMRRKLEPPKLPEGHELDSISERLGHLEECEHRLAELEERLDFTERMLAQVQPPVALNRGEER